MKLKYVSKAARELVLNFVLQSIEQKKKSNYLQEIIAIGRRDRIWNQFLHSYFETSGKVKFNWTFSLN